MLTLFPLFLNPIHHVHSQTRYQNQVTNVQCAYRILTYKDWLMFMANFYHGLWQTRLLRLDNPCNKYTLRIRQTLRRHLAELVDTSAQYIQINNARSPSL